MTIRPSKTNVLGNVDFISSDFMFKTNPIHLWFIDIILRVNIFSADIF